MPADQCVTDRIKNGLDGVFCIAVRELTEFASQFFDKITSCHK